MYLGNDINCVDNACNTMDLAPIYLGEADLNDCIINGFNTTFSQNYIHPNPASEYLSIPDFEGKINLTNQFGQQISIEGNEHFSISTLSKGLYIATFELNGEVHREKIVIQ